MVPAKTSICEFGRKAHDFALKGVDGKTYRLADVRGPKGTLVVLICNHCLYVQTVLLEDTIAKRRMAAVTAGAFGCRVGCRSTPQA